MLLIFDYDGTLHDTKHLYGCALRRVCETLAAKGYDVPKALDDDSVSKYLGVNAPDMWNDFMPELPEEVKRSSSRAVGREMIESVLHGDARLFDGAAEALDRLKSDGHTLVILSNCRTGYMDAHRERFGLDRWFSDYFCAEAYGFIPKQDIFPDIIKRRGKAHIMIGDRDSDFLVGTAHGIPVIGCGYGFGTEQERKVCDIVISSPRELPDAVSRLGEKTPEE